MTRILWPNIRPTSNISPTKVALVLVLLVFSFHLALVHHASSQVLPFTFSFFPQHSTPSEQLDYPQYPFQDTSSSRLCKEDKIGPVTPRANATMLMLARNSDIYQAMHSVKAIQDRFNSQYQYPWVFLNEEPFTEDFQRRMRDVILGPAPLEGRSKAEEKRVEFGLIPRDHWFQPDWVDETKASQGRWNLIFKGIIYAGMYSFERTQSILLDY